MQTSSALIDNFVSEVSHSSEPPEIIQVFIDGSSQELLDNSEFYKRLNYSWNSYAGYGIDERSEASYRDTLAHWNEVKKNMLYKHRM